MTQNRFYNEFFKQVLKISKIRQGLCVLVGLSVDDTSADLDFMVRKLLSVRVFNSTHGADPEVESSATSAAEAAPSKMWAKSVVDIGGEILCVSQFTLYGQVVKGSKPDFHLSMKSDTSKQMYHEFLDRLRSAYKADRIKDGEFGAMMVVNIANDGPVTLELDSRKFEYIPITNQSNPAVAKLVKAQKAVNGDGTANALGKQPKTRVVKGETNQKQEEKEGDERGHGEKSKSVEAV
ncbi:D-tyrosyl-tRNA(Tyr) deacylase [Dissophora globulifera]|nr:D-tyrosyl-tRNA(Tyr) deacylase [Dissophora globulifera]